MRKKLQVLESKVKELLKQSFAKDFLRGKQHRSQPNYLLRMILPILFMCVSIQGYSQMATENFESGIPSTWAVFNSDESTTQWGTSSGGYQGGNTAVFNPSAVNIGSGNTVSYYMVTPLVTIPQNGELQFYTKRATAGSNDDVVYQIMVSTAGQSDINGFNVELESWEGSDLNSGSETEYEKKTLRFPTSIPANTQVYLAFVVTNTQMGSTPSGDAWFVDQVSVVEGCTEVTFQPITATPVSISASWQHPTATSFEVQIVEVGTTPATSGIIVNANNYTFTNLEERTNYIVYVRAICNESTSSLWAASSETQTPPIGFSCDVPIQIDSNVFAFHSNLNQFMGNAGGFNSHGTSCLPSVVTQNYLTGNKVYFTYTATQDGLINISQETHNNATGVQNGMTGCFGNSASAVFIYDSCETVGEECLAALYTNAVTSSNGLRRINDFVAEAGKTYIIVVSTSSSASTSICFSFKFNFTTCGAPNVFTYNNLLQEEVHMSWLNPGDFSDSWEYIAVPSGSEVPTSGTATNSNNGVHVTGLAAGTKYDFYVRSICDGVASDWSRPYTFTTLCEVLPTPYTTQFLSRSATNPEPCWTAIDVNNDGVAWTYAGGWQEGYLGIAYLQTNTNQNSNHDLFASPQFLFDGVQKRIRYSIQASSGVTSYSIKISTTGVGQDNFDYVLLPETVITHNNWEEKIVNIPAEITGNVSIAFVVSPATGQTSARLNLTNVTVEDKPACPDPLLPSLVADSITENGASFTWTVGDEESQWEVVAVPSHLDAPTSETVGVRVSSTNYTFTNLDSATRYNFYVRAYCSDEYQSNWVGPVYFETQCSVFEIPFFESFDNQDPTTKKFCWTIVNNNNDGAAWIMDEEHPRIQGSTLWFNPTSSYDDWLISPALTGEGVKELKFDYRAITAPFYATTRYGIEVLISYTDPTDLSSFSVISPLFDFTNADLIRKSVYFNATGTFYIAFRVPPHFEIGSGTSILHLDNVEIIDGPLCPNPDNLNAVSILSESAQLNWTAGFEETQWEVANVIAGSPIPTSGTIANTNTMAVTSLEPGTRYEFYVRAVCDGNEVSEWTGPYAYTTLCTPYSTPFLETFEVDSESKSCWRILNLDQDDFTYGLNNTFDAYDGNFSAAIRQVMNGSHNDWLISPAIDVVENQRIRFFYRSFGGIYTEDLEVRISTTGIEPEAFTTILYNSDNDPSPINNDYFKEMILNIPAGITGPINIGFYTPNRPPGPYGFRGQFLMIDHVVVEDIPTCALPYNVVVNNISDTSVTVNWQVAGEETEWEVVVQPHGTEAPGSTSLVEYTHLATSHPFTVTDLDPSLKYDVYVRAICGDQNQWVGPQTFNTLCSFESLCEYTVTLYNSSHMGVGGGINLIQNEVVMQTFEFARGAWNDVMEPTHNVIYLCRGVEFSLFWDSVGTAPGQYPDAYVSITDNETGEVVWTSQLGIGVPRTTIYTGIASCGVITCPQPTQLNVTNTGEFVWSAGGEETQWEVAVQDYKNGTLPQHGTIVSTTSYQPTEEDFGSTESNTFEFFVRGICAEGDTSFWSGPYTFVKNDDRSTAIVLVPSTTEQCTNPVSTTFSHATISDDTFECAESNYGDVWYEFTATSKTHLIEVSNFEGDTYYVSSGDEEYPKISLVLYSEDNGELSQIICNSNLVIPTLYSSELVVGNTYKLRVILGTDISSTRRFDVCITTIEDPCNYAGFNGSFEKPHIIGSGILNIITPNVIPGWTFSSSPMQIGDADVLNTEVYHLGQIIQVSGFDQEGVDPLTHPTSGLYQDFDSSEIPAFNYSFAHANRGQGSIRLYAGAPEGPFTLVHEAVATTMAFNLHQGVYQVPEGQATTRFIFRVPEDEVGNLLDDVRITNANKPAILTEPQVVACGTGLTLESEGIGVWEASESNPSQVTFVGDVNSNSIEVTGFIVPGEYVFYFNTRYCSASVAVTYEGIAEIPTVVSPIEYCQFATAESLTATEVEGLTLMYFTDEDASTGVTSLTPSTDVVGSTTYYVAYATEEGCLGQRVPLTVVVNELISQEAAFTYDAQVCETATGLVPTLGDSTAVGGVFSSNTLTVDASTGEIIGALTAGTHTIRYDVAAVADSCIQAASAEFEIVVNPLVIPVVSFDVDPMYCTETATITPVLSDEFTTGGVFSVTNGLTIDPVTGVIDLRNATAGSYTITYTFAAGNCVAAGTHELSFEVIDSITANTNFSFDTVYCTNASSVVPVLGSDFYVGGVFTATSGLVIDAVTGEINFAESTPGVHTITYTVQSDSDVCLTGASSSQTLTLHEFRTLSITQDCVDKSLVLQVSGSGDYVWTGNDGAQLGTGSTFDVSEFLRLNTNVSLPLTFHVSTGNEACISSESITITEIPCVDIPRGISPNGDGNNDNFDLRGLSVRELKIFNRYGVEVYQFSGNYTSQWYGQASNGNELPTGTYFYSVTKQDGSTVTGWVYINR